MASLSLDGLLTQRKGKEIRLINRSIKQETEMEKFYTVQLTYLLTYLHFSFSLSPSPSVSLSLSSPLSLSLSLSLSP